jgi:hypothetical protein
MVSKPSKGLIHPFDGAEFLDHIIAFRRGAEHRPRGECGLARLFGEGLFTWN